MCKGLAWILVALALCLIGFGGVSPVLTRRGFSTLDMPAVRQSPPANFTEPAMCHGSVPHHQGMAIGHNLRFHGHPRSQQTLPVLVWPYYPYFESYSPTTSPTDTEPSPEPQIIVMLNNQQPQRTVAQESHLDFSYVGGCHAIPNGCHCDTEVAGIAQAMAAAGASILYLPPYSPDLNPIEQLFANLRALLRKAAARSPDELWDIIGSLLNVFTPAECRNYLENAGYAFAQTQNALL